VLVRYKARGDSSKEEEGELKLRVLMTEELVNHEESLAQRDADGHASQNLTVLDKLDTREPGWTVDCTCSSITSCRKRVETSEWHNRLCK
jgi:hypothetical protein